MWQRQAILIQDIAGYRAHVDPFIKRVLEPFVMDLDTNLDHLHLWMIKELVWRTSQICVEGHDHRSVYSAHESQIFYLVKSFMEKPTLESTFTHFIRVPSIYCDQEINVEVHGRNLYFNYYINQQLDIRI